MADETDAYWRSLKMIAPSLLDHSFVPINRTAKCTTPHICQLTNSQIEISDVEKGRFVYIKPLIFTNSSVVFLKALKRTTACQNLGFLSLVRPINGDGTEPNTETYDFVRPTYGYAIYNMITQFGKIYLIRAEGYVDSGVAADNQSSLDDYSQPTISNSPSPESGDPLAGLFLEIRLSSCQVYGRRVAIEKSITYGKSTSRQKEFDNSSWFANPIEFDKQLFILNAYQMNLSSPSPTMHSIVLDISERIPSGWSGTFTLISK